MLFVTTFLKGKSKCNLGICKGLCIGFYWQILIVNHNNHLVKATFYNLKQPKERLHWSVFNYSFSAFL